MLKSQGLSYRYPGNEPLRFPDFSVGEGEHLLITGGSGSGKTTLLHLIAGSLQIQAGDINLLGSSLRNMSMRDRDRFRSRNIGVVLQRSHFIRSLSVKDNLIAAQYAGSNPKNIERITSVCAELNIEDKLDKLTYRLSQGEQQRVSIARALINSAKIILADEPTSSLDDPNCEKVVSLLIDQASASSSSLIVVTHDKRVKDHFRHSIELDSND